MCCGLNHCVPLKFICWNPNPQGDGIRKWGFGEVIRSSGQSPHKWTLTKEAQESYLAPSPVCGYHKKMTT